MLLPTSLLGAHRPIEFIVPFGTLERVKSVANAFLKLFADISVGLIPCLEAVFFILATM
jgi:hypothetical protein